MLLRRLFGRQADNVCRMISPLEVDSKERVSLGKAWTNTARQFRELLDR